MRTKFLAVGSLAGLEAAKRGECDIAGIHLLDPQSGEYNRPFLTPALDADSRLRPAAGHRLPQGDARFEGRTAAEAIAAALADPSCVMVNRNQGSGTRALIDRLLGGARPPGYAVQPRNHNAVAAAVAQGRADWGVTLDTDRAQRRPRLHPGAARAVRLRRAEARAERPGVKAFRARLADPATRAALVRLGMKPD